MNYDKRKTYLSWDETLMQVCHLLAKRSKDPNTQNGACVVSKDKIIVGLGYNGFPRGCSDDLLPWGREGGFLDNKYAYVVHAEENAIFNANRPVRGCILYCTLFPCNECVKTIIQNGIIEIIYDNDFYHDKPEWVAARKMLDLAGVKYRCYKPNFKLKLESNENKKQKIICISGLCGSGKTEVGEHFIKAGYAYVRFGQITLDKIKKLNLEPTEANERPIRENLRKQYGPAAFAILNMPKIDALLSEGKNVLADGLYSWSEYKALKNKYNNNLIVIAVYASPKTRYTRLENRSNRYKDDPNLNYRSFSKEEAKARDYAEIENIEKAGPIAMADFTIINEGNLEQLHAQIEKILEKIK